MCIRDSFRFGHNAHNPFQSGITVFFFQSGNADNAVIGNIDFGIGFLGNFTNNLTAGTDNFTDFINRNFNRDNSRSLVGNMRTQMCIRDRLKGKRTFGIFLYERSNKILERRKRSVHLSTRAFLHSQNLY